MAMCPFLLGGYMLLLFDTYFGVLLHTDGGECTDIREHDVPSRSRHERARKRVGGRVWTMRFSTIIVTNFSMYLPFLSVPVYPG